MSGMTVDATPGLSIIMRSKDSQFADNKVVFVTEYNDDAHVGEAEGSSSNPLKLSIVRQSDQTGPYLRISVEGQQSRDGSVAERCNASLPHSGMSNGHTQLFGSAGPVGFSPHFSPLQGAGPPDAAFVSQPQIGHTSMNADSWHPMGVAHPYCDTPAFDVAGSSSESSASASAASTSQLLLLDTLLTDFGDLHNFGSSGGMGHVADGPSNDHSPNEPDVAMLSAPLMQPTEGEDMISESAGPSSTSGSSPQTDDELMDTPTASNPGTPELDDPKRIYKCGHPGCNRRFARKYTCQLHEDSHKPKVKLNLPCRQPGCTARFGRPHDRMRHEVAKHRLRPDFVCDDCGKCFGTESRLKCHKCDGLPTQRDRWTDKSVSVAKKSS